MDKWICGGRKWSIILDKWEKVVINYRVLRLCFKTNYAHRRIYPQLRRQKPGISACQVSRETGKAGCRDSWLGSVPMGIPG